MSGKSQRTHKSAGFGFPGARGGVPGPSFADSAERSSWLLGSAGTSARSLQQTGRLAAVAKVVSGAGQG